MPAPVAPTTHGTAAAPERGPMAPYRETGSQVTLGLAGLGHVTVGANGLQIDGPDAHARAALWARLGSWATAQWLLTRGLVVLRGAAVAKDGRALAIVSMQRTGASITAGQLTRHGWSVVSDGWIAIDRAGSVLAGGSTIRLDRPAAERLFSDCPITEVPTSRARADVLLPSAGDAPLWAYAAIGVRQGLPGLRCATVSSDTPPPLMCIPSLLSAGPIVPPAAPSVLVQRPHPQSLEHMRDIGPVALAATLQAELDALW